MTDELRHPSRSMPSMAEVVCFLLGECSLNGLWFGDDLPGKGRHWWRHYLREAHFAPSETAAMPYVDRGDAVNLAHTIRETDNIEDITRKGILLLVDAVLRMDEAIKAARSATRRTCVPCGTSWDAPIETCPACGKSAEPKLDRPAQIGATRFGVGVKWSTVIDRAQREYEYRGRPAETPDAA